MKLFFFAFVLVVSNIAYGQSNANDIVLNDSVKKLYPVTVYYKKLPVDRLKEEQGNSLFSGKKNEVISLLNTNGNVVTNNAREIFAKVPGVSIWENEGSGIQINVGVRGLSPNRSWELNTRQNGYDISSDVFGYPEAYYNPPLEAVANIQLVRGGASLQFGSQFGGMLNYELKRETQKAFTFETQNTVGSYGLFSSYNAIGGTTKKIDYYIYNDSRNGDGWRENGRYNVRNTHAYFAYKFNEKTKLSAEYTNKDYDMQQAGGLTDVQFQTNPQQSLRNRNWFGTPWNVAALIFDTQFSDRLSFNAKLFGLIGERNSVGFLAAPNVIDVVNATTDAYANRQVDRDFYKNIGLETRSIFKYSLGNEVQKLAFGIRLYQANMNRQQQGKGTTGSDFDLSVEGRYNRDLNFTTDNFAAFAENQFKITPRLSVAPGMRFESIRSTSQGRINITNGTDVLANPQDITRNLALFGLGVEYKWERTNLYGNFSQAFRPVLFSDLTPSATTDVIDPNLKDGSGYNLDLGYRGSLFGFVNFDVSYFYLLYKNRVGGIRQFINDDPTQGTFLYRTNLGETIHKGFEGFVNVNVSKAFEVNDEIGDISLFATMAFIDATYTDFRQTQISGTTPNIVITQSNLAGKQVENAPRYIHNFGISWDFKNVSATLQNRMTSKIYTDANNTENPTANGITGALAGFRVYDFSMKYQFLRNYNFKAGINNLTNTSYATRRAGGYPGPGILPNEGRTFYVSIGAKF
ncbi:FecA Outer membrane receptor for Fe3+-dicitrate [Flavobacteriaceae bacterium]